jgi:hypothetical protein
VSQTSGPVPGVDGTAYRPPTPDQNVTLDYFVSAFCDTGVEVVAVSKRLGHTSPAITLKIYAHLFRKDDGKAAEAINAALAGKSKG